MSNDWGFYPLLVDSQPASIYLDLGLANVAPISAQPNMGYVSVSMRQPRPDGLSSSEEFEALSNLEDMLIDGVAGKGTSYVGRNTSGGYRDFYFYTADPAGFEASVKKSMSLRPEYQFTTGGRADPEWDVYRNFLYPAPDDLQRLLNRRVTDALTEQGDTLSKPRMIDHWAYMPNAAQAPHLQDYLRENGFTVDEPQIEEGAVTLSFHREDAPSGIDEVVIPLARRVQELGGEYDGWGCEVEK
jgi:hypothetical protein